MTNASLARSCPIKARARPEMLGVLMADAVYSDVVREAQEIAELAPKSMLRQAGAEPPKWHDVGQLLDEHRTRFDEAVAGAIPARAAASAWLREEPEFSLQGQLEASGLDAAGDQPGVGAVSQIPGERRSQPGEACRPHSV